MYDQTVGIIQMSDPLVTVIVLLYNDMPHGHRAIQSVLSQSFRDLKIKIMDNGSTDNTWSEIQDYAKDPRVTLIKNGKNQRSEFTAYEALQTNTEYLSFLFGDDYYLPRRIEEGLQAFRGRPDLDAAFSNVEAVDEHDTIIQGVRHAVYEGDISSMSRHEHLRYLFFRGNSLHPCSMLIKTKKYCDLGGFKPYFHHFGDMIFFARLLAQGNILFLKDKMQRITVWSNGRNESARNIGDPLPVVYERTAFLDEYLSPKMMDQIVDIFTGKSERPIVLGEEWERLWYLGHQALNTAMPDYNFFAFRCLYKAAEIANEEFHQRVAKVTGKSMPQYLESLAESVSLGNNRPQLHSDFEQMKLRLNALEQRRFKNVLKRIIKKIPFSAPTYRFLKRRFQRTSKIMLYGAVH